MFGAILGAVLGGGGGGALGGILGGVLGGGGGLPGLGFGLQLVQTVLGGVQNLLGGVREDLTGMRNGFDPSNHGTQSRLCNVEDRLGDVERQVRCCQCEEGSRPGRGGKNLNERLNDLADQLQQLKNDVSELRRGGGKDCCEGGEGGERSLDLVLTKLDRTLSQLSDVVDDLRGDRCCSAGFDSRA
jgi:hypothetical protein